MKKLFILLVMLPLVSCKSLPEVVPDKSNEKLSHSMFIEEAFSFEYPTEARHRFDRSDGSIAISTNSGASWNVRPNDFFFAVIQSSKLPKNCSDFVADGKEMKSEPGTYTIAGNPPPFPCEVDHCDDTKYGYSQYKGRHVLCSEHGAKMVRIEINQVTDNPDLAKQIFETFRWTK